eukprot:TRINITY_DN652_c0_g1_i1.p1 TRINITY_DN652_c0_g1~~TRINITY_DN652_c0_g1_i1.p1  ORF type:complete len:354 (-),score=136.68 TRINITY_DN652_c0_g1_i1:156-1217(-)
MAVGSLSATATFAVAQSAFIAVNSSDTRASSTARACSSSGDLRCSSPSVVLGSSFFTRNNGIQARTFQETVLGNTYFTPSNGRRQGGGGALTAEMNIFDRVARIVKSYTNAALSAVEDPEKMLDQTVDEMADDLAKMRQATAQVLATQKILENKYKQAAQTSDDWYKRARLALEKGQEDLAREALKRKKDYEESAKGLKAQLEQQSSTVNKLVSSTRLLEEKISEAKAKKETLKARAQSAKTSQKVNEMLGNMNTSSALTAFDKMEEKVIALEAQSEALTEMNSDDLANKFALLETGDVDDDLAQLRRDMLSTSQRSGELPAGRSPPTAGTMSVKELELEAELQELRKRAAEF